MKKLVIFDLDGTLLYTLEDLHASTNFALESEELPTRSLDAPALTDRVFAAFVRHYAANCMNLTCPYPGIPELLMQLKAQGSKLGVVSNKADGPAKALIEHYFPGTFDSVVGERENVRKKPAPDSVLETVRSLGCTVDDAVYVGDSDVDGQTAVNANCDLVLVSWGFRGRETLEPFGCPIANSAQELFEILN